jgi:hypothetical protein
MKDRSSGDSRIAGRSMNASMRRASGSAEKNERPVSGLCCRLGRKEAATDPISSQARSSWSTPPEA